MTAYTGRTKYIMGEFGIAFTVVVAVLAAYFWMRRAEVAQPLSFTVEARPLRTMP
jgi:hypothetical protein